MWYKRTLKVENESHIYQHHEYEYLPRERATHIIWDVELKPRLYRYEFGVYYSTSTEMYRLAHTAKFFSYFET